MKSTTKYVILGLLNNENLTGYEMKKIIDSRMPFFWNESYGQIYPALKHLVEEQMVQVIDEKKEGKTKTKSTYAITQKGVDLFEEWLMMECQKDSVRIEVLLKIFFATESNIDKIQLQIEKFYAKSSEMLKVYDIFEEQLKMEPMDEHNHKYMLQFLELGRDLQRVYTEWSKDYLEKIKTGEL